MALLDLHLLGSPVLRERAAEVEAVDDEVRRFIDDLYETMDVAEGIGLAANQVGVARRVAVIGIDETRLALVNPEITATEGKSRGEEGCLSIPDLYAEVTRPERITVRALDRDGKEFTLEADGLLARAIQHEIDHLDGILFVDHLSVLKRQMLLARWRREHKDQEPIKPVRPAGSRPA